MPSTYYYPGSNRVTVFKRPEDITPGQQGYFWNNYTKNNKPLPFQENNTLPIAIDLKTAREEDVLLAKQTLTLKQPPTQYVDQIVSEKEVSKSTASFMMLNATGCGLTGAVTGLIGASIALDIAQQPDYQQEHGYGFPVFLGIVSIALIGTAVSQGRKLYRDFLEAKEELVTAKEKQRDYYTEALQQADKRLMELRAS